MPKASLNPDKARQGGGGVEPGVYEVVGAKTQNLKTDFKPNQLYLVLEGQVCDKDGDPIRGADAIDIPFGFGEKSLESFHPGTASSRDDDDPKDEGDEVDAEGNTIWAEEGSQFSKSCAAMVFMESLKKHGFPADVLDACYAPDFVGAKFDIRVMTAKEVNDWLGTRLNTKPLPDGGQVTYKVAYKWLNPTYLGGGKSAGKAAGKTAGKTTAKAEPEAKGGGNEALSDAVKGVLATIAADKSGQTLNSVQKLVGLFVQVNAKEKAVDAKDRTAAQKLIQDPAWLTDALSELGVEYEAGGDIVFP